MDSAFGTMPCRMLSVLEHFGKTGVAIFSSNDFRCFV
jgi:hypothetical protein